MAEGADPSAFFKLSKGRAKRAGQVGQAGQAHTLHSAPFPAGQRRWRTCRDEMAPPQAAAPLAAPGARWPERRPWPSAPAQLTPAPPDPAAAADRKNRPALQTTPLGGGAPRPRRRTQAAAAQQLEGADARPSSFHCISLQMYLWCCRRDDIGEGGWVGG